MNPLELRQEVCLSATTFQSPFRYNLSLLWFTVIYLPTLRLSKTGDFMRPS